MKNFMDYDALQKFNNQSWRYRYYTTTTTTILGIETSCDDTSVAVVNSDRKILAEYRKAQWDIHKKFNGVVPKLASEAHIQVIDEAVEYALRQSNKSMEEIDAVAVTTGPGIALSLQVGVEKAVALAKQYNKPLISVNHLEGHCLTCRLSDPSIEFPFMTLLWAKVIDEEIDR
ncbi:hypothetical protein PPL_04477 [Heterostelium album PN500]|uniref:N(6)-L-threonylcarbamoyladenine synthase n=1 Tax=Heterostelium pallidum (strain ATCC 26659 / Pp 5 / PN500) TaxID=670386 RepID=D3B7N9_HETP5|nr:hypothetical protein PPL_04477 [Heterostelium album PN500]EFA82782.1 hypothetical protein PPL_04477 [Heterostelium album PN500]|eukprot:XP_020434899.1 hypothetical protein PPL_04477 [Heterostelium album PN500]